MSSEMPWHCACVPHHSRCKLRAEASRFINCNESTKYQNSPKISALVSVLYKMRSHNTLQHTATLQHTVTHRNTLQVQNRFVPALQMRIHTQRAHWHYKTLQYCNTLHRTATHRNTLQHVCTSCSKCESAYKEPTDRVPHCNTLQHTSTYLYLLP